VSSNPKSPVSHPDPAHATGLYRVAIVGAGTIKGKEVAEILGDRNFPAVDIKLLDDDESLGQLEAVGEEVTFIQKVRSEQFDNLDFTFFASDAECTRKNWKRAEQAGSAIVDMSFALENSPGATLRSPWIERELGQTLRLELQPGPSVIAHPAAVVLALILLRVSKAASVARAVAMVFEPASEHGQRGMDELHEQTVNLLSFQPLPKAVFDTQVAFNMVGRYGERAIPPLEKNEERIINHYRSIAGDAAPVPSLLLVQAPIFHGHAFAIHVEMQNAADIEALSRGLAGDHVRITHLAEDSPSNVSAAGQADVLISIKPDPTDPKAAWIWAAADNLRVAAITAVECAETMAATRPRGKIQ
jgi:aspartate-semialdehyde dehydrogenase